ncbi:hypothetical protein EVA_11338 [gut metagenome]|uniref:Uncharacterized protein n=1 Tax=gut metagenome TaxID=749906 RepID=J9CKI6_9ZZZZ
MGYPRPQKERCLHYVPHGLHALHYLGSFGTNAAQS